MIRHYKSLPQDLTTKVFLWQIMSFYWPTHKMSSFSSFFSIANSSNFVTYFVGKKSSKNFISQKWKEKIPKLFIYLSIIVFFFFSNRTTLSYLYTTLGERYIYTGKYTIKVHSWIKKLQEVYMYKYTHIYIQGPAISWVGKMYCICTFFSLNSWQDSEIILDLHLGWF